MSLNCRTLASARVKRMSGKHQKAGRSAEKGATEGGGTARASRKGLTIKRNPEKQEQGRNAHIQSASETVQQGKHLRRRTDFQPFSGVATGFRAGSRACHALHTTAEHPATDQLLTSY